MSCFFESSNFDPLISGHPVVKEGQRFLENQEVQSIILPGKAEKRAPDFLTEEVPHRNPDATDQESTTSDEDRTS